MRPFREAIKTHCANRAQSIASSRDNLVRQRIVAHGTTDGGLFRAVITSTSIYLQAAGLRERRRNTCKTDQSRVRIAGGGFGNPSGISKQAALLGPTHKRSKTEFQFRYVPEFLFCAIEDNEA